MVTRMFERHFLLTLTNATVVAFASAVAVPLSLHWQRMSPVSDLSATSYQWSPLSDLFRVQNPSLVLKCRKQGAGFVNLAPALAPRWIIFINFKPHFWTFQRNRPKVKFSENVENKRGFCKQGGFVLGIGLKGIGLKGPIT